MFGDSKRYNAATGAVSATSHANDDQGTRWSLNSNPLSNSEPHLAYSSHGPSSEIPRSSFMYVEGSGTLTTYSQRDLQMMLAEHDDSTKADSFMMTRSNNLDFENPLGLAHRADVCQHQQGCQSLEWKEKLDKVKSYITEAQNSLHARHQRLLELEAAARSHNSMGPLPQMPNTTTVQTRVGASREESPIRMSSQSEAWRERDLRLSRDTISAAEVEFTQGMGKKFVIYVVSPIRNGTREALWLFLFESTEHCTPRILCDVCTSM
jgi:hypothetical protein